MKKIAALFVFAILAVCILSVTAFAEGYGVYINGTQFTSENPTITFIAGTATFDPTTRTLTLNEVEITAYNNGVTAVIESDKELKIVLNRTSHIFLSDELSGISVSGDLEISGNGTLNIDSSGYGNEMHGIGISADNLVVKSGTINTEKGNTKVGIQTTNDLTVEGGNITAAGVAGHGISAKNMTVKGGTITATGENNEKAGIFLTGDLTVDGGKITATGTSWGIWLYPVDAEFILNGGTVIAKYLSTESSHMKFAVNKKPIVTGYEYFEWRSIDNGTFSEEALPKYIDDYRSYLEIRPVTPIEYDVSIDGVKFTNKKLKMDCGTGTATFDPDTNTLTLEDATINDESNVGIRSNVDLKLVLKGNNQINVVNNAGINAEQNKVEISGEGSINIFSKYLSGILAKELVVKSGTINVSGEYYGMDIRENMVVDGGAITAEGENIGIDIPSGTGKLYINGGSLKAEVKESTVSGTKKAVNTVPVVSDSVEYKWRNGSTAAFSEAALPDYDEFSEYLYFEIIAEARENNFVPPYAEAHQIGAENPALSEEENPNTGADFASILCAGAVIVLVGAAAVLKSKKHL